jgi:hypothetical protein
MTTARVEPEAGTAVNDHWDLGIGNIAVMRDALDELVFALGMLGCTPSHARDALASLDEVRDFLEEAYEAFEDAAGPGVPMD